MDHEAGYELSRDRVWTHGDMLMVCVVLPGESQTMQDVQLVAFDGFGNTMPWHAL